MSSFVGRCTKNVLPGFSEPQLNVEIVDEESLNPGDVYRRFQDTEFILYMRTDTGSAICEESNIPYANSL